MLAQEIMEDLEVFTKEAMQKEGISEYDLHMDGQTEKGTNYGSEIVFFRVTPKDSGKEYNLVMKTAKRFENFRDVLEGSPDTREMFMYAEVFPAIRKMLQESKCSFQLENISKIYLVSLKPRHETVIMDNLKALGYRLWDKTKPMNLEHIKTVISTYGKFHGSSIALRHNKPEIYNELTKGMNNIWEGLVDNPIFKPLFQPRLQQYVKDALKILEDAGLKEITRKLEGMPERVFDILARKINEEDKVVITHGNCWINNMMFKYKNSESMDPTGVCFLDFQISSPRSPATDLSYFLYTACDGKTLAEEFWNLLELYYQSLSSTLTCLKVDPKKAFTFESLKEHWRKYAIEGLVMASVIIKVQLAKKDETMDFGDLGKEGLDYTSFLITNIEADAEFKKRIVDVYKHYAQTCLQE